MQLQYVLGNPIKNKKISRKKRSGLFTSRKARKIKKKAGGNPVAKRKSKLKKGSAAAKAWGRKMKRLRMASGKNPRRKRRKNPAKYVASGKVPMYRNLRGSSKKFHTSAELQAFARAHDMTARDLKAAQAALQSKSLQDILLMKELGTLKAEVAKASRLAKAERSEARQLAGFAKKRASAEKFKERIEKEGGSVAEKYVSNPRKRKKKKKPAKRKAKRKAPKKARKAKARKSRRKGKRKASRRESAHVMKTAKTFRVGKGRKKRRVRVKTITVVGNPSIDSMKPLVFAAGGYVLALALYKGADAASGGKISEQVAKLPALAQPLVLPAAGIAIGMGLQHGARFLPGKIGAQASSIGRGAVMVGSVVAALALVNTVWQKASEAIKTHAPQVAQLPIIGSMLSGVMYFPGMHGADFGMYPQMGDGYRQTPGDFGGIPRGMHGIPAGMRGIPAGMGDVEYFPNRAMGEVQFYPPGSDGDRMYEESEAGQLMEAEGLGGADFGEIPSGMGEGQLG